MPNPYHDETGKFCSKAEMFNGVLRLQLAGKTDEAAALFLEFKQAENAANGVVDKVATVTPASASAGSPAKSAVEDGVKSSELAASVEAENARVEASASELRDFFHYAELYAGSRHEVGEAEEAYRDLWERGDDSSSSFSYDPSRTSLAQRVCNYHAEDGTEMVLFAYKNGLYTSTESMDDSWGASTKHGYDTRAVKADVTVIPASVKTAYAPIRTSKVDDAEITRIEREGEIVDNYREEVTYGKHEDATVYKTSSLAGEFYFRRMSRYSSWDRGYDDLTVEWSQVQPKEVATVGRLSFETAD